MKSTENRGLKCIRFILRCYFDCHSTIITVKRITRFYFTRISPTVFFAVSFPCPWWRKISPKNTVRKEKIVCPPFVSRRTAQCDFCDPSSEFTSTTMTLLSVTYRLRVESHCTIVCVCDALKTVILNNKSVACIIVTQTWNSVWHLQKKKKKVSDDVSFVSSETFVQQRVSRNTTNTDTTRKMTIILLFKIKIMKKKKNKN